MRFVFGVMVGIFIGRPVLDLINEHMTPPMRNAVVDGLSRTADGVRKLADSIDARVESYGQENT